MIDPSTYPPAVAELLRELPLAPLGPGEPRSELRPRLERAQSELPLACRAGLWLAYNFLDEAHTISQDLETAEGSCWHALMHRREPDYSNSKYWFRRVGRHPIYGQIPEEIARRLLPVPVQASFLVEREWDAMAFVDLCERSAEEARPCHELCRQVQKIEWELLFAWCYQQV